MQCVLHVKLIFLLVLVSALHKTIISTRQHINRIIHAKLHIVLSPWKQKQQRGTTTIIRRMIPPQAPPPATTYSAYPTVVAVLVLVVDVEVAMVTFAVCRSAR